MSIDFPEDALARMWEEVDWDSAEKKLAILQERLSIAAYRMDDKAIRDIQRRIVRDPDIKCLAVRHVVRTSVSPGVDRVKWKTPAEMMKAAFSLTSKAYGKGAASAAPYIQRSGHERTLWLFAHSRHRGLGGLKIVCVPARTVGPGCPRIYHGGA